MREHFNSIDMELLIRSSVAQLQKITQFFWLDLVPIIGGSKTHGEINGAKMAFLDFNSVDVASKMSLLGLKSTHFKKGVFKYLFIQILCPVQDI